jgi:capsular exopolysaccharide synthesis family protein
LSQLPTPQPAAFPLANRPDSAILYSDGIIEDPGTESILRRYWRIFFKRRWVIASAVGACLAVALVVSLLMKPQYTATVRIQVAREAAKVVDMEQVESEQSGGSSLEFYQTQYALLKSRSLSEAVVRDLDLADNLLYLARYRRGDVDDVRAKPLKERLELAADMVNKNTSVSPVRGSSIIDVGFTSPDPVLSAKVANSIGQNFIQSSLVRRYEAAAYARNFLENRLRQVRARLEDSERKAVQYAQQQGLIRIKTGGADNSAEQSLLANQLAELSTQLTTAHAKRAQAEAEYREGVSGSAAAQSLSSVTLSTLRPERADLIAQLTKLQSDFGPEYPPIIALKSQIQELVRQIQREEARVNSSVAQDLGGRYKQALAAESALQQKVDALKAAVIGEEGRSIQYNILQRDVDTNRALYEALLQRFKEVGIAGGVGTNNVAVVDRAIIPDRPSSPNLPLNLALGLILGLIAGAGAALVLEQLAESVILPSEFQARLRIPLLGSTPAMEKCSTAVRLLPKPLAKIAKESEGRTETPPLGSSPLTEAYQSIVASLRFSTDHGAPTTIAVTSTREEEGKTTTAVAIARIMSSTGARVLLIDADMRRPSIHRTFELGRDNGLSDVLTGHAKWDRTIHETAEEGLFVIPAGKIPPSPATLLASGAFGQMIKEAGKLFNHVIVDCPPLLGLADATLISAAVEGTVFVMEAGRTRASEARHALDRLAAVQSRITGAVLTKLDSRSSGYGYGYAYTYKYHADGS